MGYACIYTLSLIDPNNKIYVFNTTHLPTSMPQKKQPKNLNLHLLWQSLCPKNTGFAGFFGGGGIPYLRGRYCAATLYWV